MKINPMLAILFSGILFTQFATSDDEKSIRVAPKKINPSEIKVGTYFPSLSAKAIDGRTFSLAEVRKNKATVIALTSTSCPVCRQYVGTLAAIEKEFSSQGVAFCFLNTLPSDKTEDIRQAIKENKLQGPYVHDKKDKLNESLEIRTTAEVFVFDSSRKLVYRGAVDDQFGIGYARIKPQQNYLRDALNSIVNDRKIEVSATTAPGCDIWIPSKKKVVSSELTYHEDIAKIVQDNCVSCHREKGSAPFSLESVDDITSHAGMIETVIKNETMPPWFTSDSDRGTGKWANDRRLADQEKKNLIEWLGSSRKTGDAAKAPKKKSFTSEWNIEKRNHKFTVKKDFRIKASGQLDYVWARVYPKFKEDKWIKGVEIRPKDPSVVHHVLVFVDGGNRRGPRDGFFAAYVPGNTFQVFPDGFAKKIPADATLAFQIHYTPNGRKATTGEMEIGLQEYEGTPKHVLRVQGIADRRVRIPAGASNHKASADLPIGKEVKIMAFMPHMHLRGKAFQYEFILRDKDDDLVLDIPQYDFNWQLVYRLAKPVTLQRGDTIEARGWFDNSKNNPANPDPTKVVRWGDQTDEEMMLGYVEYYYPNEDIDSEKADSKSPNRTDRSGSVRSITKRLFDRYDKDRNGKVTREELTSRKMFERFDLNKDGQITFEELIKSSRRSP